MSKEPFEHRERIVWRYRHHTNRRTSFLREKHGIFVVMKLEKRYNTWGPYQYSTTLCKVHFDGNSNMSIVPVAELTRENQN
jgi:hypothetical protein